MNEKNTNTRYKDGPAAIDQETDWERLLSMSDEKALENALSDPDAQPLTDEELAQMQPAPVVTRLRLSMGLTQTAFAERFGLKASVIRDWEQLRSKPDTAAQVLLGVIESNPGVVARDVARRRGPTPDGQDESGVRLH